MPYDADADEYPWSAQKTACFARVRGCMFFALEVRMGVECKWGTGWRSSLLPHDAREPRTAGPIGAGS